MENHTPLTGSFLDSESHGKGNIIWQSGDQYSSQFEKVICKEQELLNGKKEDNILVNLRKIYFMEKVKKFGQMEISI